MVSDRPAPRLHGKQGKSVCQHRNRIAGRRTTERSDFRILTWRTVAAQDWFGRAMAHNFYLARRHHRNANLWEIMTDPGNRKPTGRATKITDWDGRIPWPPTVSRDGNRLALVKGHVRDDVYVGELKNGGTRLDFSDASNREREHGLSERVDARQQNPPFAVQSHRKESDIQATNGTGHR